MTDAVAEAARLLRRGCDDRWSNWLQADCCNQAAILLHEAGLHALAERAWECAEMLIRYPEAWNLAAEIDVVAAHRRAA